jgi:hypothetical protein
MHRFASALGMVMSLGGLVLLPGCTMDAEEEAPHRVVTPHAIAWNGVRPGFTFATGPVTVYVFDAPVTCKDIAAYGGFDVDRTLPRPLGARVELMIEVDAWAPAAEAKAIFPTALDGTGRAEDLVSSSAELALTQRPDGSVGYGRRPFQLLAAPTANGAQARARIDATIAWSRASHVSRNDEIAGEFSVEVCGDITARR